MPNFSVTERYSNQVQGQKYFCKKYDKLKAEPASFWIHLERAGLHSSSFANNGNSVLVGVESANAIWVHNHSLAVAMAAKTRTLPCGGEVRVVITPTGEVIVRKDNDCGQ